MSRRGVIPRILGAVGAALLSGSPHVQPYAQGFSNLNLPDLSRSDNPQATLDQYLRDMRESIEASNAAMSRALNLVRLESLMREQAVSPERAAQIEATYDLIARGIQVLDAGNARGAIDTYFDPLLVVFEDTMSQESLTTYVASSSKEGMYYILMEASRDVQVQAITSYGADVYYWKTIALERLGDFDDARESISRALELSPANAWYLAYRARMLQRDGDWSAALAGYEMAAEFARLLTPESDLAYELGFALRGRAYVLIELDRLDEAARQYEECLELDSEDLEAATELAYVREVMRRRGR